MDDKTLHDEFQKLPKRCLVLFEEIDTAGIVRRGTMKAVPKDDSSDKESEAESEESDSSTDQPSKENKGKEAAKPQGSKVTLGGLLNVLDGPGAKEGRLVIFTTNSPKSLDQALIRPGRIDRKIYLGRSTKLVASITFSRIFGTDPRLKGKIRKSNLDRMAKEFGDLVPANTFTPCEIQSYCMSRRGKPAEALKKFPEWIEEQRRGGNAFNYDIAKNPNGTDDLEEESDTWHELVGSGAGNAEVVKDPDSTSTTSDIEQLPETRYQLNRETLELENPSKGKGLASDLPKNNDSHRLDNVPMTILRGVDSSDPNSESSSSGNSVMSDTFFSAHPSALGSSSLQRVSNFSHPFFSGVRNMYSLNKGLENADEIPDDGRTVMLRTVDPIPVEDILVLDHGDEDKEGFDPEFSVWSIGMF
jgi:chaperone BCS1